MHTGGLVSMFGHVGCAYVCPTNMEPRAHLEQSPCRRVLLTARSFSRGLVPGSDHSFVNFRASGAIEVPLESSAASGTCPRPSQCPPDGAQASSSAISRPARWSLACCLRIEVFLLLGEFGRTCHVGLSIKALSFSTMN